MRISKKNEVYLTLSGLSNSELQEFSDFFTFEVPGARFMPMYRNRMWDGKIRLFSPRSGEIYVGLLSYIKEFCVRNKIKYIIITYVEILNTSYPKHTAREGSNYDPSTDKKINVVIIFNGYKC